MESENYCQLCDMIRDINEDPMYWLGAALFSGILFASLSRGILYLLAFYIIYEILYYFYYKYNTYHYDLQIRIGILAGGIMGFLIGRHITETDNHSESIKEFWDTIKKFF